MGRCCRADPTRGAQAQRWPPTGARPRRADRHPVCPALGHPVGDAGPGDGLWLWHDLLAQAARRATGRRLGSPPSRPARPLGLEPSLSGQRLCPREKAGEKTGPNPTDRGRPGCKRHLITDANGVPLAIRLTPANGHDSRCFENLIDAVPSIRQCWGRPRRPPAKLHADKAYDAPRCRKALRMRRIKDRIGPGWDRHQPAFGPAPLGRGAHARLVRPLPSAGNPL